ncbi:hypothetical protein [Haladaptatus cibarius]|uniref:hypothetical protein n=1 Tax=Haladaptatus cibarius TaxID=453847 RepID=UPI0006788DDC|nr:hypothetical protein [Haladaptatus cibarius]
MSAKSKFLAVFSYISLAIGGLFGLLGNRFLAEALFWPSAPIGASVPALISTFGIATLVLGVDLMVRHTLRNPYSYGASDTVRNKWKQW